ncbi:Asp23/Gls24 family envelope stress response protein [Klenkia sp. PcliD-1-E]|uniref:Asp23/Gls24 family envelope stress response protein n=1 Tax=Klenkia sp. PcliD-1-E TaxID=2954492 RepID=UPI0020983A39|nr:Asp23/Gls24 family envelope stress response protein [Klenkia sp. PcliD-1-E]MCO7218347.1 Asp23/Gls24 family envelope stress response protein [Klenkia sp. PcliD-1-E]
MTTAHPTDQPADQRAQSAAEGRGALEIADRVIEKIAAHAAAGVPHATGSPRRVLGLTVSEDPGTPQVTAKVHGDVATVFIDLAVTWPAPVTEVTRAVRAAVIDRLTTLVGIGTAQVDIEVSALPAARREQRRVA